MSEEINSCTVPGGLAAVRKQFENGEMIPSRTTLAHSKHQHKSAEVTFLILTNEVCPAKELKGKIPLFASFWDSRLMQSSRTMHIL